MATLANLYDFFSGRSQEQAAEQAGRMAGERAVDNRLRPFPNDDVHLFIKKIDNSRVIRAQDPDAPRVCWKTIGGAGAVAVFVIAALLPAGYNILAGYQIQDLKSQNESLAATRATLAAEEEKLSSPAWLAELARRRRFIEPSPMQVIHLDDDASAHMARNTTAGDAR